MKHWTSIESSSRSKQCVKRSIRGLKEEGVEAPIEREIGESDEVRKEQNQIVLRMEEVLIKQN